MSKGQIDLFDEIIVDNFAGGGGASTGIELATGRPVTVAINHDPAAILMHKTNHPYTVHLQDNVWNIDPEKICAGRSVGLAWFSPDCKHFSKAKGSALVDRNIRGLAWIVLKWAGKVRPRVIMLENVEEFQTWGPVRKGKPVKNRAGQTFAKWKSQLESLGYTIEHRELVAADYGAPTTRKRFVLVARCDGRPIVWPKRTHAPADSPEVAAGLLKAWRSAAEIIDWSLPCPSIFESSDRIKDEYGVKAIRPLKDNTLRRIARGIDKFVIKSGKPFIVPVGYGERVVQKPRVNDIDTPIETFVGTVKHNVCQPIITTYGVQVNHGGADRMSDVQKPLGTATTKHGQGVVEAVLAPLHMHNNTNAAGTDMRDPVNTITTGGQQMLITPHLSKFFGGVVGSSVEDPTPTVTAIDHNAVVATTLIQYHAEQNGKEVRASGFERPLMTVDGSNRYGIAAAYLSEYYGNAKDGLSLNDPLHTVTAKDREGVTLVHITEFKGQDIGQRADKPLRTITASVGEFGAVKTRLEKIGVSQDLKYWTQVRELLNRYCGYNMADDEILLINIGGEDYFISDIGLRMLTPKELYKAQGFPEDYIIDQDYTGKPYPKNQQVARCGNAVCPPMVAAVVRANMPEYAVDLSTMYALMDHMAV